GPRTGRPAPGPGATPSHTLSVIMQLMKTLLTVALAGLAAAPAFGAPDHAECSHLVMLKLPDVKITEAAAVPAAPTGAIKAPHCRVNGMIGSEIHFTLLMPDDWNRKFMMGGGGGFVGQIQNQAGAAVNDGYACVGTAP